MRLGRFGAVSVRAQMEMPPGPEAAVIDQKIHQTQPAAPPQALEDLMARGDVG